MTSGTQVLGASPRTLKMVVGIFTLERVISMYRTFTLLTIALLMAFGPLASSQTKAPRKVRVACLGDSLVADFDRQALGRMVFSAQLENALGEGYEVRFFHQMQSRLGVDRGWPEDRLKNLRRWAPDVVLVNTQADGIKDWVKDAAKVDAAMAEMHTDLGILRRMRVIICTPFGSTQAGKRRMEVEELAVFRRAALKLPFEVLNVNSPLAPSKFWSAEGYASPAGIDRIVRLTVERILNPMDEKYLFDNTLMLMSMTVHGGDLEGFGERRFKYGGVQCRLALPVRAAKGRPWLWRTERDGLDRELDTALLERGWHLLYTKAVDSEQEGKGAKKWNGVYGFMTSAGLSKRPLLGGSMKEGSSHLAWAKAHSEFVLGILATESERISELRAALPGVVAIHDLKSALAERAPQMTGSAWLPFALRVSGQDVQPCCRPTPSIEWRSRPAGWGRDNWPLQHQRMIDLGLANSDLKVVFFGDSITQSWTGSAKRMATVGGKRTFDAFYADRKAASFGLSGDRTEHLLWRLRNGAFDAIDPKLIVLMIGVNNIRTTGDLGAAVAAGTKTLVEELRRREPQAEVLLLGSFPTGEADSWARRQVDVLHEKIAPLGNLDGVRYLDLRRRFLKADGDLDHRFVSADGVHLKPEGYRAWAEAIEPTVREVLKEEIEQEKQPEWLLDAARVTPSPRQLAWQDLEMTCFIHFGINTFTDREWGNGLEDPKLFNPTAFDAEQWVLTAKAAGMKLMLLTAKHHDGFCLWPSRFTPHSVANSPWRKGQGDVVRDLVRECKKHGLKFGVYLSPADLNAIDRGVYGDGSEAKDCFIPTQVEGMPFPAGKPLIAGKFDSYNRYFMNQLYELLTEYGPVDEVWFDGANPKPGTGQGYDREAWYSLIRALQPQAVIAIDGPDVRWIGNEGGHARVAGEWSVVPVTPPEKPDQVRVRMSQSETSRDLGSRAALKKALDAGAELRWYPAEMNTSIRGGWFYHAHEDGHPKAAPTRLMKLFETGFGGNAVLLLNVSPDRRGLIHEEDVRRLRVFGEMVRETLKVVCDIKGASALHALEGHPAAFAIDGDLTTWWQPAEGINRTTLEFALDPTGGSFDLIQLREAITKGQRIEKFSVEAFGGSGWVWLGEGRTVGNRRLLSLPLTKATKLRIHILSSRLCPTLSEVSLHRRALSLEAPKIWRDREGRLHIKGSQGAIVRYTLDGEEPTKTSKVWGGELQLTGAAVVKARAFHPNQDRGGETAVVRFDIAQLGWKIRACSSEQADAKEGAAAAIDGDPKTLWHSRWRPGAAEYPHWVEIDFGKSLDLKGFSYLPRSDGNTNGCVLRYRIEVSEDGLFWQAAAESEFENMKNDPSERRVMFERKVSARYLRFTALEEINQRSWASAAEIGVVTR